MRDTETDDYRRDDRAGCDRHKQRISLSDGCPDCVLGVCTWAENYDGIWETDCGQAFEWAALRARVAGLREALEPFVAAYERAKHSEAWASSYLDNGAWSRAHAALGSEK